MGRAYVCVKISEYPPWVVWVLEVMTWGGAGVSVLVCTLGAAFEMDWWKFGGVSVDTTI